MVIGSPHLLQKVFAPHAPPVSLLPPALELGPGLLFPEPHPGVEAPHHCWGISQREMVLGMAEPISCFPSPLLGLPMACYVLSLTSHLSAQHISGLPGPPSDRSAQPCFCLATQAFHKDF